MPSQTLYLLRLGPPSGCSTSPWSSVSSCISSLLALWQRLPEIERPKLAWAGQGEALIAPPSHLEPKSSANWNLALIVKYPEDMSASASARVELLGQFVDIFFVEVEEVPADLSRQAPPPHIADQDVPKKHTLPGYDRVLAMYEARPNPGQTVHMINLLSFAPKAGRQQYQEYLEACAPALSACGAKIAYHADLVDKTNDKQKQWDSLLIGAYPDKHALIRGVVDPEYMKAFNIRAKALQDAMLLATHPLDLHPFSKLVESKL